MIKYRPDIDGLRAIAVAIVVLFHGGIPALPGGFVGVDVFFVISGFLITSLLLADDAKGGISILRFYERRIRRIFPALFAVCLAVAVVGCLLFMPFDLRRIGMQLVATATFASNILFWLQAGYFDADSQLKPLLHTWSLAVEEQYYIVYPLLVGLTLRYAPAVLGPIVAAIAAASFAFGTWQISSDPAGAFYLPFDRAWELMLGGLIALRPPVAIDTVKATLLGTVGLVLIVAACCLLSPGAPFPGWRGLVPCLGTAGLIVAGYAPDNPVSRLLAHRLAVGLGLVSYSLYLWHWPIFVAARYLAMRDLTGLETTIAIALSLTAGYLSWRYIEQPFRRNGAIAGVPVGRTRLFAGATVVALATFASGIVLYRSGGLPGRLSSDARLFADGAFDTAIGRSDCDVRSPADIRAGRVCRIGAPDRAPSFVVLADSIGISMLPGFDAAGIAVGRSGLNLTRPGCYPLAGIRQMTTGDDYITDCFDHVAAAIDLIRTEPSIRTVFIVGRWTSAADGTSFGEERAKDWYITDAQSPAGSYLENRAVLARGIERTAAALRGREVLFLVGMPEQHVNIARAAALGSYLRRGAPLSVTRSEYDVRQVAALGIFAHVGRTLAATRLDLAGPLCTKVECPAIADGHALYSDDVHLTRFGALRLVPFLRDALQPR